MKAVQVQVLGRSYSLRTEQSQAQVQRVADFVSELLQETAAGRTTDTRDLTVLTLLNLAGKYLRLVDEMEPQGEAEKRLKKLIAELEEQLSGC